MWRVFRSVLIPVAAGTIAATSCEPCAGLTGCGTAPRVAVQGRLVDVANGHAISGARVSLVRTDADPRDSSSTVTDAGGNFQVELRIGTGTFDIDVEPLGLPPYRVRGLHLESSTRAGDAHVLPPWVATPMLETNAQIFDQLTGGTVPAGKATFRRTGGAAIPGPTPPSGAYSFAIDVAGRVVLFRGIAASSADDVVGDLTVRFDNAPGARVIQNLHIKPYYVYHPRELVHLEVGAPVSAVRPAGGDAVVVRP